MSCMVVGRRETGTVAAAIGVGEAWPPTIQASLSATSKATALSSAPAVIGVVMGSSSDWETLRAATAILAEFGIAHEARVVSAHRMPDEMFAYAEAAAGRGLRAIIAGAGGAAHLPGMLAAKTTVPVLGVPVESRVLKGLDSLYSIVQMPQGIPVATFAIGSAGAANAALFAVAMLAAGDAGLRARLEAYRAAPERRGAGDDGRPEVTLGSAGPRAGAGERPYLAPGATLGVVGGGQLGRMFVHAAQTLGYRTVVLDADPDSPAGLVAHEHIRADYLDPAGLERLAAALRRDHDRVRERSGGRARAARAAAAGRAGSRGGRGLPGPRRREGRLCQERHRLRAAPPDRERGRCRRRRGLALPGDPEDGAARLRRQGSGRRSPIAARSARRGAALGGVACVLEQRLPLAAEISVIVARGRDGQVVHLPVQDNVHEAGILAVTRVPARAAITRGAAARGDRLRRAACARARLCRRPVRRVLRSRRRRAGRQRDRAAAAQLGPLQHRCLRPVAVRAPGAHAGRRAAGRAAPAFAGRDAEPARRSLAARRRRRRARLARRARARRARICISTASASRARAARWAT